MGLREYWLWIIALQFVLQSLILILLLLALARRSGDCQTRSIILRVLAITLATVLLEAWLTWSLGWIILVPILGVTVLVLMNASWGALWSSCIAVAFCGGFFACLTLDFWEFSPAQLRVLREEREARKQRSVARYQQVAGELDRIAPKDKAPSRSTPPSTPGLIPTPTPQVTPAPAPALNLESRAPLADRLVTAEREPKPVEPFSTDIDWRVARSLVEYRGSVSVLDGERVLHINGRLLRRQDVLKVICHGTVYRWFIVKGDTHTLDLKRLNSCSMSGLAGSAR
ncbi:MAG: hypothetical protein ISS31_02395 [Kiritimatiellae bacterium]|nr:hypothetical protein [Kiritimatiellia bacterium]